MTHPYAVLLYLTLCLICGILGRNTRVGFVGIFFASILATPLVAIVALGLCTGDRRLPEARKIARRLETDA